MIFRPFLEVCKHKFGHNSVNIDRRDLRLLFLERQLNFALFAAVFCGLHFHNLSQNLRDFLFFAYVAHDFFADSALFCLEFFRGTNFRKFKYRDQKLRLFRFRGCITSLASQPISPRKCPDKNSYRNQCLKCSIFRKSWQFKC